MTSIANKIKTFRKKKGLSQYELAVFLGTKPVNISRWERGVHDPSDLAVSLLREKGVLKNGST